MKRIFLTILFLLITCNAMAATYYVKTGGDDTAAGTSDGTAWAHCPGMDGWTGSATLASGDTVYFREGDTWASAARPILETREGVTYYGKGYGTTGNRAKFQSVGTPSGTPISGVININASYVRVCSFEADANQQSIGGIYVGYTALGDATDISIDDCVIHETGGEEAVPTEYLYGILVGQRNLHTTRNVSITNCEVYNTGHEGIAIYPSRNYGNYVENVTVRGCTVHDTGHWGGTSWGHGIYIALHTKNILIEYNTVYNTYSVGVVTYNDHTDTYPYTVGYPDNITIRYNLIYNSLNMIGITLNSQSNSWTGWGNVYIYGNIMYDSLLWLGGGNLWNKEIKVFNNTIYNNKLNLRGICLYKTASNTSGIEIKNNLIYTGTGTAAFCLDDEGALLSASQHTNNLYYRASGNLILFGVGNFYTSANIKANYEDTAQTTDPTFTGGDLPTGFSGTYGSNMVPNTTYFSLQAGSPALNNGAVLASPYSKAINNAGTDSTYTRGTAWDIGAYEATLTGGATITNTGAVFSGMTF